MIKANYCTKSRAQAVNWWRQGTLERDSRRLRKGTTPGLSNNAMAGKKKTKRFRAVTAVKELARERIGTPPPTRVIPDRRKGTKDKHKPTLRKLLEDL